MGGEGAGLISVRVVPQQKHQLRGLLNNLNVMVEIKTSTSETKKQRMPLDLAIVLVEAMFFLVDTLS
jgi:hypothetical protein